MATSYTSLLGLALPVTGELAGTWGDTVNNYITSYLDAAVAGAQTISGNQTAVTLSVTNGTSLSQAGSGATGSSQYQIINCTGNPAGTLTVTVPAASKIYLVLNATSTSQSVKVVGAGPTTGVTMIAGETALITWNGSDFVKIASTPFGGRINPRVSSTASAASVTPDISLYDQYAFTALAAGLTINAPTGTPLDGNKLLFRILDNGTTRTLTWNATYTVIGVTLPTATVPNKTVYVGCVYNANNTRWDVVGVVTQA
jgi:hypothetical protein